MSHRKYHVSHTYHRDVSTRRPAPTILFTALAATIVVLPWAINGSPGSGQHRGPLAEETILSQQSLAGIGGGETLRELRQDEPFSMVAVTGTDLTGTSARIRPARRRVMGSVVRGGKPRVERRRFPDRRTPRHRPHLRRADHGSADRRETASQLR